VAQPFVVFVPGILGTELRDIDNRMIWGGSLAAITDTLCVNTRALSRDTLRVGRVIEFIEGLGLKINVYGPMLRMIRERLGDDPQTFHAFAYDWRQSNMDSAAQLAQFVRSKVNEGIDRFAVIAHSMGGIVTRLALGNSANSDLLARLSGYVQIATPVLGSSKAIASLKLGPSFHPVFDRVRNMMAHLEPSRFNGLLQSLGDCDSIFQLLPPPTERVLIKESGLLASPFDSGVWPHNYQPSLDRAKTVHTPIQASPTFPHHTILSGDVETDYRYLVDLDFNIVQALPLAGGDGTVCEHSAGFGSDKKTLVRIDRQIPHDKLPNDRKVFDMIFGRGWLGIEGGSAS
jgi:pimeloyl-ACP methyl ester carboxylesterase